jgi:hypothetical protein
MRATPFALAALLLAASGCTHEHLSSSYGRATRKALSMQQAIPARPPPAPSMALDTQEAGVIAKSYTKSLAGKTGAAEPEDYLYISNQREAAPIRLAPSVPKE